MFTSVKFPSAFDLLQSLVQPPWFSSNGKYIVSCGDDKAVRVWDFESGECLKVLEGHTDWVSSCCISLDSRYIVSCGSDKTVRVWDFQHYLLLSDINMN